MSVVQVYCDDQSHEGRVANVAEFLAACDSCSILQCTTNGGDRPHSVNWSMQLGNGRKDLTEPRRAVRGTRSNDDITDADIIWRYRLECPLCGLNATAGESRVIAILDTLTAAGIDRIPLGLLAARMQSSK